jgi:Ca-activated chloride channel homolog
MNRKTHEKGMGAFLIWRNQEQNPQTVPLKSIHIEGEILDMNSGLTIQHTFVNNTQQHIEAVYCFPVEAGATVTGFTIETDNQCIKGKVEERDKAFKEYDEALMDGNTAFLLDREDEDILYLSVGNLAPGQLAKIKIQTIKELTARDNSMRIIFPTTVSPRYAPAHTDPVKTDRLSPEVQFEVPYCVSLDLKVFKKGIEKISSPSHSIIIHDQNEWFSVSLNNEKTAPDRDIVLDLKQENNFEGLCLVSTHENGDTAGQIHLSPTLPEDKNYNPPKTELYFVLDCSGSMGGSSIESAKRTLELCLRQLSSEDTFNIYIFGSHFSSFSNHLLTYNQNNFDEAIKYIKTRQADMGGTEMLSPLKEIANAPKDPEKQTVILMITDGQIMNTGEILDLFKHKEDKIRAFAFGIGYGASHGLLSRLADITGGAYEALHPGEEIAPVVLRQFARLSQPLIRNISIHFDKGEAIQTVIPENIYEGDTWYGYTQLKDGIIPEKVEIKGKIFGENISWTVPVQYLGKNNLIPSFWAHRMIEKEDIIVDRGSRQFLKKENIQKKQSLELALRYSLLTDDTGFVGIQERREDEKNITSPEFTRIPVQLTHHWGGTGHHLDKTQTIFSNEMFTSYCIDLPDALIDYHESRIKSLKERYRKVPQKGHMQDKQDQYMQILQSQQVEGYFSNLEFILSVSNIEKSELNKIKEDLKDCPEDLKNKILATLIVLKIARHDTSFAGIAKGALQKAEKWLKDICSKSQFEYKKLSIWF